VPGKWSRCIATGWKNPSAVGTRCRLLERVVPRDETSSAFVHLCPAPLSIALVVLVVIGDSTVLAPRLVAVATAPSMELVERLVDAASPAALHSSTVAGVADGPNDGDTSGMDRTPGPSDASSLSK
jgi:hypothetical protein